MTNHDASSAPATPPSPAADPLDDHWSAPDGTEDLHDGGTHLLDLVAAVDHLGRGLRHDFTVWDALEEALAWHLDEDPGAHASGTDTTVDPLRARLGQLVASTSPPGGAAELLQAVVRRWNQAMAQRFNAGNHWNHPASRRGFPPPHQHA